MFMSQRTLQKKKKFTDEKARTSFPVTTNITQ